MGYTQIKNIIRDIKWFYGPKHIRLEVPKSFKTEKQKINFIRKTETFLNKIIVIDNDR
ncbi:MAG: hypothetical protein Unbinned2072contig1001_8 [Prokaryotic dsDNA virus sp.]|nr:MAG: hypothetical protein Unbinned2072contig1001_8 [Prokaryotic dsDNA virus sp.]|tara:strand:- start:11201 stop:11374 length:174 start_codon:yes stop_codon:yes gene_type:complete